MAGVAIYLSILTLNVNGFNSLNKSYPFGNWTKKKDLTICWIQETQFTDRNNIGLG
jgi:exonuclease III